MARKRRRQTKPIGGWQLFYGLCVAIYAVYLFSYGYNWTELRFTSHENSSIDDMLSEYVGCTVVNLCIILIALITRRGRLLTAMLFLQTGLIFITAYAARIDVEDWLSSSHARSWWDLNPLKTSNVFVWSGGVLLVVSCLLAPILLAMKRTVKPAYAAQWAQAESLDVDTPEAFVEPIYEDVVETPEPVDAEPMFDVDLADEPA